jgi:nucleoside-diphosphate-sugar epimerase
MDVLVTGGAGLLGSELIKRLVGRGYAVRVFDLPTVDFWRVDKLEGVEIFKGDVTAFDDVQEAVKGVKAVFHLAAILPPISDKNRELTIRVNVDGTENLLKAVKEEAPKAPFIFSSSVAVYGRTASEEPPISENHALSAIDNYSESKIQSERLIRKAGATYTILRISGIFGAEFFELPDALQYRADQRVEFVDRRDVVAAFLSSLERNDARNRVFNIAGGETWQMLGKNYTERICEVFEIPAERDHSKEFTWFDWYDTSHSQAVLNCQHTPFEKFLSDLKKVVLQLYQ